MKFGAIIIGDEILSGKRQDKHLARVITTLGERGLELSWAQYLGDDPELITATLRRTFAGSDTVFSFGGIGATPDDHTRQCAALAADLALKLHPAAEAEIRARFVDDPKGVTPQRLMMGEFPEGAAIIPNPYNRIPGFSVGHHHFLPGFPEMAWPMMAWVLDHRYAGLSAERAPADRADERMPARLSRAEGVQPAAGDAGALHRARRARQCGAGSASHRDAPVRRDPAGFSMDTGFNTSANSRAMNAA